MNADILQFASNLGIIGDDGGIDLARITIVYDVSDTTPSGVLVMFDKTGVRHTIEDVHTAAGVVCGVLSKLGVTKERVNNKYYYTADCVNSGHPRRYYTRVFLANTLLSTFRLETEFR